MKNRLLVIITLCLAGLVGCATVPTIGQEEPKEVDLYALADRLERPPDPIDFDDMPEEVKAAYNILFP